MMTNDSENIDQKLYVLNEKNILITKKFIKELLKKYGNIEHKIKNLDNFQTAMTHTSYLIREPETNTNKNKTSKNKTNLEPIENPDDAIQLQEKSYERLEFLGDAVIHLILAEYLYKRYEKQDEGFMTRLRTKIENSDTLADLCQCIGLNKYILLSKYIEVNGGRENNRSILEDSFESFMGALLLDAGFNICNKFFVNLLEHEVDFANLLSTKTNFKDILLQHFHKEKYEDPIYSPMDVSGPEHKKSFTMCVICRKTPTDDGIVVGIGVGASKKKGEQEAAKDALMNYFKVIGNENDSDQESIEEYYSEE